MLPFSVVFLPTHTAVPHQILLILSYVALGRQVSTSVSTWVYCCVFARFNSSFPPRGVLS